MHVTAISTQFQKVIVPASPAIANLFPQAKTVTLQGKNLLAIDHRCDETRMLRNLGINVPAPVLYHYDWCGKTPFEVQRKTAAMLTTHTRAYVLNSMGTGKTKAALWSYDFLRKTGDAKKCLVVAPLSTLTFTWAAEVLKTTPHLKVSVLHGTREKRIKALNISADIYVVNHDGVKVLFDELKQRNDIDTLIIDELAVYRNGSSTRTKKMRDLAKGMRYVWGMTGSPMPNEPTDVWGQASIVTPNTVPKYFTRFRDEVMYKVNNFIFRPKDNAVETAYRVLQPSVRFTLDDIVELPQLIERTIDIKLGAKQASIYKAIHDHARASIASHDITAMNAGAVLMKLLQISTGWVYTREKEIVTLPGNNRLQQLEDDLNSLDDKAIVFVPFIHALQGVMEHLTAQGFDCAEVSGNTPQGRRNQIFNVFQNTDKIKVLVAHPQCMAHGITLTAATTIIWFAPFASLEVFDQANARIRRVGQTKKQQVLMYQATAAERRIYTRLRQKQKVQNELLDLLADAS